LNEIIARRHIGPHGVEVYPLGPIKNTNLPNRVSFSEVTEEAPPPLTAERCEEADSEVERVLTLPTYGDFS